VSGLVAIRRDRINIKRSDGETVRLPLTGDYEGPDGLPSDEAVAVLAHELATVGEDEAQFDLDAVAPDLLTALAWAYARRDEMAELFGSGEHRGLELASHLLEQGRPDVDWFVPGVIAKQQVTLIEGREKIAGKSSLLAYLMAAMEHAEGTVFGPAFHRPVRTVWLTEEPEGPLYEKAERFGLGAGVLIVRNYALPDGLDFPGKLRYVGDIARAFKADHVVIDPLSRVARVEDEAGTELGRRAEEASDFAQDRGIAITIVHHDNKGRGQKVEDRGRGSTSLQAHVDQIIHIEKPGGRSVSPRVRRLVSWGRVDEAAWTRDIEMAKDKRSYTMQEADGLLLSQPMTVKDFADKLAISEKVARSRLVKLVSDGDATVDETTKPYVYAPILASDVE